MEFSIIQCPFCGKSPTLESDDWFCFGSRIRCSCGVGMSGGDPKELVKNWNKRTHLVVEYPDALTIEKAKSFDSIKSIVNKY